MFKHVHAQNNEKILTHFEFGWAIREWKKLAIQKKQQLDEQFATNKGNWLQVSNITGYKKSIKEFQCKK